MKKIKYLNPIKLILVCLSVFSTHIYAQTHVVIADYPLIENLSDNTGDNTDVSLQGNPNIPTTPSKGVELCANGIYLQDPDGQDIITPILSALDINKFTIEVEFKATQLPSASAPRPRMPVIMGSKFARWLGIYVRSDGIMGFKFNNSASNYRWSNTAIAGAGIWYSSKITYVNGHVELFLDEQLILTDNIPALGTFLDTFNFTITDFSEGTTFYGCIRNLKISAAPDDVFMAGFE